MGDYVFDEVKFRADFDKNYDKMEKNITKMRHIFERIRIKTALKKLTEEEKLFITDIMNSNKT